MTELRDMVTTPERRSALQAEGGWDGTTLWAAFSERAHQDPDALAVVDQEGLRSTTRSELLRDASAFAAELEERGLRSGDVLSVQLPNRYEAVVTALAAFRLGLAVNTLLPNYRAKELEHIFRAAAPRAVVSPAVYRAA